MDSMDVREGVHDRVWVGTSEHSGSSKGDECLG
jgi:hypothetical protein